MNLLLITFSFPPVGGVGVLRATSLAKYLPGEGIRVDVLTAKNAPAVGRDEALFKQIPDTVTIHRTLTLDLPFGLRKWIKKVLSRSGGQSTIVDVAPRKRGGIVGALKRFVGNLLLPDPQIGWLPFATRAAKRIIRERSIDTVIITVPPFSSVALAKRLRSSFPNLKIVVDFRDEWLTTTLDLVSFNKNAKAREVAEQSEREAVTAADSVVMVTEKAVSEIRRRYPTQDAAKFFCVPNGFDQALEQRHLRLHREESKVTLTYIGSVYGSTDPTTFVQALGMLSPEDRKKLAVRFIGRIESEEYRRLLLSHPDVIEVRGFVPQSEAIRMLSESDFALLITRDPINVSAKFYDYLGAGVPILAALHPQGEVRSILERTRTGLWADVTSAESIRELLERVIAEEQGGIRADEADIDAVRMYHRQVLARRYADHLRSMVEA